MTKRIRPNFTPEFHRLVPSSLASVYVSYARLCYKKYQAVEKALMLKCRSSLK